jgi:hypothetical protein
MRAQDKTVRDAAEALKLELAEAFPGVAFTVTADEFPGGDMIVVTWTGGPMQEQVRKISGRYERPHTPGAADLYVNRESGFTQAQGGAKYVVLARGNEDP